MYPSIVIILVYHKSSTGQTYGVSALLACGEIVGRDVEAYSTTIGHFTVPHSTIGSVDVEISGIQAAVVEREKGRTSNGENDGVDAKAD